MIHLIIKALIVASSLVTLTIQSGSCLNRDLMQMEGLGEVRCTQTQIKINGVCKERPCKRGFYFKNGQCHRCHNSCKTCIDFSVCDSCSGTRALHSGQCHWKCPRKHKSIQSDSNPSVKLCVKRKNKGARCLIGEWTPWTECGRIGTPNVRTRTRVVAGGAVCAGVAPIQHRHCLSLHFDKGFSGCIVSEWLPWEQCDESCKNKFRRRRRIVEALPNGSLRMKRSLCPNLVEEELCPCYQQNINTSSDTDPSSQCEMDEWTPWSGCDALCGRGLQRRTRSPVGFTSPRCKTATETRPCCDTTCREYCSNTLLGEWSSWGRCQGTCDYSFRRRARANIFPSVLLFCDMYQIYQEIPCKLKSCRDRCVLSEWGAWSDCHNGTKLRQREMLSGSRCPSPELVDTIPCLIS